MAKKYIKTGKELAEVLGISRVTLAKYQRREGYPKPTSKGFDPEAVGKFIQKELEAYKATQTATIDTLSKLKNEKLQVQIDILKEQLEQIKGNTVTREQHNAELTEYALLINGALDAWVSNVATKRQADILRWAEQSRIKARQAMVDALKRKLSEPQGQQEPLAMDIDEGEGG